MEGLAKRGVGERPISSPSPAKGWGKSAVAGRGTHGDSPIMCAAPIAAPARSAVPLETQRPGEPVAGSRHHTQLGNIPIVRPIFSDWSTSALIPLSRRAYLITCRRAEQMGRATVRPGRRDLRRLSLGRGWGRLSPWPGGGARGSVPSVSVGGLWYLPLVAAQLRYDRYGQRARVHWLPLFRRLSSVVSLGVAFTWYVRGSWGHTAPPPSPCGSGWWVGRSVG